MKRLLALVLIVSVIAALACVPVYAADIETGYVSKGEASGVVITEDSAKLGKFTVTVSGAKAGKQYLLVLVNGSPTNPTKNDTIRYIEQVSTSDTVKFENISIYPDVAPVLPIKAKGEDLTLFITSDDEAFGNTRVIHMKYVSPIVKGDVTGMRDPSSSDAAQILRFSVDLSSSLDDNPMNVIAADVTGMGDPSSSDASQVLRYSVELPSALGDHPE